MSTVVLCEKVRRTHWPRTRSTPSTSSPVSSRTFPTREGTRSITTAPIRTWETRRAQKGTAGVLTNFTGGAEGLAVGRGTTAERAAELAARLDSVFPGVSSLHRPQEAVRFHWPTHPWTLGSYACYRTGQVTAFGGAEGEREGGVFFAGEQTSRDFQGFMEGACESGERAAKEVLAAMGIPASPAKR